MIHSGFGSGSYFWKKIWVPVPVPDSDLLSTVFQQQKICTKSDLVNARIGIVSHKVGHLTFDVSLMYEWHFMVETEPECIRSGFGSAKTKICGSGSCSTTLINTLQCQILVKLLNLPNSLWLFPSVGGRERDLRASAEEPQELPLPRPHLLQADDVIHQQLDAHQDHQALRGSHSSRTKVRIDIGIQQERDVVYLGWPVAPSVYEPKCGGGKGGGGGGFAGSQPMSITMHMEPK